MIRIPHWPQRINNRLIEFDLTLTRLSELLNRLGNPHEKMPKVLHVAGTNGKGSTVAFLYQILVEAGYKVHRLISPYLLYFNERIILANEMIKDDFVNEIMEECRIAAGEDLKVSFFEGVTAGAFLAFSRIEADFVILEVGLGGIGDATNIISDSLLSIITSISFDHTEFLGDTIEEIAMAKAGIMRKNRSCIVGYQDYQGALSAFDLYAKEKDVTLLKGGIDWGIHVREDGFTFRKGDYVLELPIPKLRGVHQMYNAANAIAAIKTLDEMGEINVEQDAIKRGLMNVEWPSRIEKISEGKILDMIPEGWELFIDGAHNIGGAKSLSDWLSSYANGRKVYMIFGTTRGKEMLGFIENIKDIVSMIYAVCVRSEARAALSEEIVSACEMLKAPVYDAVYLSDALRIITEEHSEEKNAIVIISGSLYLTGDVAEINDVYAYNDVNAEEKNE